VIEYVDVVTRDGVATGVVKPKAHVHRDGDLHTSAHLWVITPAGDVLLQKRSLRKENHPGLWDVSVAGHLSAGEDAVAAAVREAAEEVGLQFDPGELQHIGTLEERTVLNEGRYIENELHEIFVAFRDVSLSELRLQDGEVDDAAIVPVDELLARGDVVPHREEYELLAKYLSSR
jgi:isopentenyl-diphosphate Delta-isomerase